MKKHSSGFANTSKKRGNEESHKILDYLNTGFDELSKHNLLQDFKNLLREEFSITSIRRIANGNVNQAFEIMTDKQTLFCKIAPTWYENSLKREAWALKQIKEQGCLVPDFIEYFGQNNVIIPGHEILFLRFVDGELLSEMSNKNKYTDQIINLYDSIHTITTEGFGWLDEHFKGENNTWKDFLLGIENQELIHNLGLYWSNSLLFVQNELETATINSDSCHLLYGDFNYSNFIVNKENKVIAFDFQNCFSGDPLYDTGMMIANDKIFEQFLNNKRDKKIVYIYALRHLLSMLTFFTQQNNKEKVAFIKMRFSEIKKALNKLHE